MKKHMATRVLAMLTALCITGAEVMPVFAEGQGANDITAVSLSENTVTEDDAEDNDASVAETAENESETEEQDTSGEELTGEEPAAALEDFEIDIYEGKYYVKKYNGTSPVVEIPDKDSAGNPITIIGEKCFANNTSITSVTIPESITTIWAGAFSGCTGLKSLTVNATNLIDCTKYGDSRGYFYNAGVTGDFTVTFGPGVTRIPGYLFFTGIYDKTGSTNYCKISKVIISDSVTEVGEAAFANCWDLKEAEGGAGVKTIWHWGFQGTALTKFPTSFKAVDAMGEGAFSECPALAEANLPEGLTYINSEAFKNCYALSSVTLPATLVTIELQAFQNCTGLKNLTVNSKELKNFTKYSDSRAVFYNAGTIGDFTVTFGPGVLRVPSYMFYTGAHDKNSNTNYCKMTKVVISDSVTEIGEAAFANCWNLSEVEGGAGVKTIWHWGFCDTALKKYPDSLNAADAIGEGAFKGCPALAEAVLPEGLTYINSDAFADCTALTTLTLPSTLVTLEDSVFANCTGLKTVTIKSKELKDRNVTDSRSVFYNAGVTVGDGMTVTFTSGVTHIPSCLFGVKVAKNNSTNWCRMYEVFIPGTVKDVGDLAFMGCYGLQKIHFQGKAPNIAEYSFCWVEATAFYPDGDKSWTKEKRKDYGGTLTWQTESGKTDTDVSKLTEEVLNSAVTFITNGAEETGPFYTINKSGKKAKLTTLHKKGYTFKGWYFNGKKVKSITPKFLKKNPSVTLEAKFTPIKYTISYKVPKKVDGAKVKGKIKLTKEEKKISYEGGLLTAKGSELTCEGHTLKGWTLTKDGSTVVVKVGETVSLENLIPEKGKTIKLYPVW